MLKVGADKRHSIAVVVGISGKRTPTHEEYTISDTELKEVDNLINQIKGTFESTGVKRKNIILTALAELSTQYLNQSVDDLKKVEHKDQTT